MKKRAIALLNEVWNTYLTKNVSRSAAALSYYLTLSLFPLIICICIMLTGFDLSEIDLIELFRGIIPSKTLDFAAKYFVYVKSHNTSVIATAGILLMLTSSSAAFRILTDILADIQGKSRFTGLKGFFFSFVMSVLFLIVIYLSCLVIISGEWLINTINSYFNLQLSHAIWNGIRYLFLFLILIADIYGIYLLSLPERRHVRKMQFGISLAALVLVGVSMVFSWLIDMSANYTLVYGSLASLIILMLWFYACGTVLILAAVFDVSLKKIRESKE